ncbi:hypothetical protein VNO77_00615 [Canavalia gladiata]|uniref:Uncharacterized protein n=1 Tax=Canavalia gladiata TaxID=3824 RepID=A0AAN9MQB8_CANGL
MKFSFCIYNDMHGKTSKLPKANQISLFRKGFQKYPLQKMVIHHQMRYHKLAIRLVLWQRKNQVSPLQGKTIFQHLLFGKISSNQHQKS